MRRLGALTLAATAVVALAACGPEEAPNPTPTAAAPTELPRSETKGGTVEALTLGPATTWDPQRIVAREDIAVAGRLFARTLTAYGVGQDAASQSKIVGDLATGPGTASKDLRTWSFTLRNGASWENGTPLTCADIKYGIARSFATEEVKGGLGYALAVLDVPKRPDGTSIYAGPYDTSVAGAPGRTAFDKAVTCSGSSIQFRLSAPMSDFNELLTLPAFGPYRKADDRRGEGTFDVQSTGPYMLKGAWQGSTGATFVRNPHWSPGSDPVRKAYPDSFVIREGVETPTAVQQVTADGAAGARALTLNSAPPALQQQILAATALRTRTINPRTTMVDYLVPNYRSQVFRNDAARRAFALATDRAAYVNALGGPSTADPSLSLIPAQLRSSAPTPLAAPTATTTAPTASATSSSTSAATTSSATTSSAPATPSPVTTSTPAAADPARALLESSGLQLPVKITVAYRQGETADKAMAALVAGWKDAGFEPTLEPLKGDYFTTVSGPTARGYDAIWSNWAPEWASASTILPALFDSRINLTATGTGRDYGYFHSPATNAWMDRIPAIADRATREAAWARVDDSLIQDAAYVPLAQRRSLYVAGSGVRNFSGNEIAGGYVELGDLAVE